MAALNEKRFQYGLASLFWLTFVAAVVLGSWRIGWWKVVATVAVLPALLLGVLWVWLLFDKARH